MGDDEPTLCLAMGTSGLRCSLSDGHPGPVHRAHAEHAIAGRVLAEWPVADARPAETSAVNHPAHYGGGDNVYEVRKVIKAWKLPWELGDAVKYIARAGKKPGNSFATDIIKAIFCLQDSLGLHDTPRQAEPVLGQVWVVTYGYGVIGVATTLDEARRIADFDNRQRHRVSVCGPDGLVWLAEANAFPDGSGIATQQWAASCVCGSRRAYKTVLQPLNRSLIHLETDEVPS